MGLIALAAFIFWDGLPFKIIYGLVALLALAELLANYHIVRLYTKSTFYVILECLMTIFGAYVICFHFSRATIIAAIVIAFTLSRGLIASAPFFQYTIPKRGLQIKKALRPG
jgi:hypothetical protein